MQQTLRSVAYYVALAKESFSFLSFDQSLLTLPVEKANRFWKSLTLGSTRSQKSSLR